jgi:tetratricopeptide (TPR) repeat protein
MWSLWIAVAGAVEPAEAEARLLSGAEVVSVEAPRGAPADVRAWADALRFVAGIGSVDAPERVFDACGPASTGACARARVWLLLDAAGRASEAGADPTPALAAAAEAATRAGVPPELGSRALLSAARGGVAVGDPESALGWARAAYDLVPGAEALLVAADASLVLGRVDEALVTLGEIPADDAVAWTDARVRRAAALRLSGRYDEADQAVGEAEERAATIASPAGEGLRYRAAVERAELLGARGALDDAARAWSAAEALAMGRPDAVVDAVMGRAGVLVVAERYNEAEVALARVTSLVGADPLGCAPDLLRVEIASKAGTGADTFAAALASGACAERLAKGEGASVVGRAMVAAAEALARDGDSLWAASTGAFAGALLDEAGGPGLGWLRARAALLQARFAVTTADPTVAFPPLKEALVALGTLPDGPDVARLRARIASLTASALAAQGQVDDALATARAGAQALEGTPEAQAERAALLAVGAEIAWTAGRLADARSLASEARVLAAPEDVVDGVPTLDTAALVERAATVALSGNERAAAREPLVGTSPDAAVVAWGRLADAASLGRVALARGASKQAFKLVSPAAWQVAGVCRGAGAAWADDCATRLALQIDPLLWTDQVRADHRLDLVLALAWARAPRADDPCGEVGVAQFAASLRQVGGPTSCRPGGALAHPVGAVDQLQRALAGETLVWFVASADRVGAFVVDARGVRRVDLGTIEAVSPALGALAQAWGAGPATAELAALSAVVWTPLRVEGRVVVVPGGVVGSVPFHLLTGADGRPLWSSGLRYAASLFDPASGAPAGEGVLVQAAGVGAEASVRSGLSRAVLVLDAAGTVDGVEASWAPRVLAAPDAGVPLVPGVRPSWSASMALGDGGPDPLSDGLWTAAEVATTDLDAVGTLVVVAAPQPVLAAARAAGVDRVVSCGSEAPCREIVERLTAGMSAEDAWIEALRAGEGGPAQPLGRMFVWGPIAPQPARPVSAVE